MIRAEVTWSAECPIDAQQQTLRDRPADRKTTEPNQDPSSFLPAFRACRHQHSGRHEQGRNTAFGHVPTTPGSG